MRMLVKEGYIEGVRVIESDLSDMPMIRAHHGAAPQIFDLSRGGPAKPDSETLWVSDLPAITLKGLEYLEENSLMKKAMELAKDVRAIAP